MKRLLRKSAGPRTIYQNIGPTPERVEQQKSQSTAAPSTSHGPQSRHKPGPIPDAIKQEVIARHQAFREDIEAIAAKCNKPAKLLYQLVAEEFRRPRGTNSWNVFEREMAQDPELKGLSRDNKVQALKELYDQKLNELGDKRDDPQERAKLFATMLSAHATKLQGELQQFNREGKLTPHLHRMIQVFIDLSALLDRLYGVQVFGWALSPDYEFDNGTPGMIWGGGKDFERVRRDESSAINKQLRDFQILFGYNKMKHGEDDEIAPHIDPTKKDRDGQQSLFSNFLREDIEYLVPSAKAEILGKLRQMPFASWIDVASKHKLCIVGWPVEVVKFPGGGFDLKKDLPGNILDSIVKARQRYEVNPQLADNRVKIIRWTEAQQNLPLTKQKSVPIVIDTTGRVLATAFTSTVYQ
ncbi:hypothetical protein BDN72DRAFT_863508 [Pluteus cervinus]|uniref:Uncharacterized protein n=1 Tax=Pluteus cervinus TaxID=181527 RepID=A0ACD3A8D0_9AGAR|nr:hypothetical protein BDN72DRAFT_863508 [Pluteus cervinus]